MPYTNCISLNIAINELDLFDNIEFKYLKKLLNPSVDYDDYDFEVDIQENPDNEKPMFEYYCITVVNFDLENPSYDAEDPWCRENKYIRFTKRYEYNGSSIRALQFMDLYEESEESCDDEDEESEESCDDEDEEVVPVDR